PDGFTPALAGAARPTPRQSIRVALTRLQLRGKTGEVVASDARQLLVQRGFRFPWPDDVLVPRVPALAGTEVSTCAPVGVGRTPTHVIIQAAPWAFALPIDTAS